MTTETTSTPTPENAPALTINDLKSIRNIIDVATQRGAFRASEIREVGTIYDKLDAFLKSIEIPRPDNGTPAN